MDNGEYRIYSREDFKSKVCLRRLTIFFPKNWPFTLKLTFFFFFFGSEKGGGKFISVSNLVGDFKLKPNPSNCIRNSKFDDGTRI